MGAIGTGGADRTSNAAGADDLEAAGSHMSATRRTIGDVSSHHRGLRLSIPACVGLRVGLHRGTSLAARSSLLLSPARLTGSVVPK